MKNLLQAVSSKFAQIYSRLRNYSEEELSLSFDVAEEVLWIQIKLGEQQKSLALPVPYYDENGNYVVGRRVKRAIGTWYFMDGLKANNIPTLRRGKAYREKLKEELPKGRELTYWQLMQLLLTEDVSGIYSKMTRQCQLERAIRAMYQGRAPITFRSVQNMIDEIVNKQPLTDTPMKTWAACKRVSFLQFPNWNYDEQSIANEVLFPWSSLGLSDSAMVKPYLLKVGLRNHTPFGIKHHNPQRNLYQTLGMKGGQEPLLITSSAKKLADKGISRGGWNLMTCFLDLPLNFEDQLIVDVRHLDKMTAETQRFLCFGELKVVKGDNIEEGQTLAVEPSGKELQYWTRCDSAEVLDISEDTVPFNGEQRKVKVITVRNKHLFKEGVKLTNCHGNKGVVTFADCGKMFDSGREKEVPIDVIVSARTIAKRRNYGQVLEALCTLTHGNEKQLIVGDNYEVSEESLVNTLKSKGYSSDGTCKVSTQWGEFDSICGWVFWGLIKNPENQLWTKQQVLAEDNRGLRRAGNKVSHIEFKSLITIFGSGNPIVAEILSHQQGVEDVNELLTALQVMRGIKVELPVLPWSALRPINQRQNQFHTPRELSGTIADENILPGGFMLKLPRLYQTFIPKSKFKQPEERLLKNSYEEIKKNIQKGGENIFIDKVYVPNSILRGSWQHDTGLWGLSDIGGYLNNVISACYRVEREGADDEVLFRALKRYFHFVSTKLSTKTGEIANRCLAVRYPHSAKATATLAKEGLPENWLEIHEEMAADLGVKTGDYVIAERFPCLGFMSLRIQRVRVTDDPQCRFVIRVSGNSLVSQNLDFDGDVLFLMSFHTQPAKELLQKEFENPNELRKRYIDTANQAKQPITSPISLNDFKLETFPKLTAERQSQIVDDLTGVKRGTGTVVALAYNLMRIIEGRVGFDDKETNLAMEVILDKVANSVFSKKHAGASLEQRCRAAICTADLESMLEMGFPEAGSRRLCEIIKSEAASLKVFDLKKHYKRHLTKGRSNIINTIVREKHPLYFATRANLHPMRLLGCLAGEPTDLCALLFNMAQRACMTKLPEEKDSFNEQMPTYKDE